MKDFEYKPLQGPSKAFSYLPLVLPCLLALLVVAGLLVALVGFLTPDPGCGCATDTECEEMYGYDM